MLRKADRREEDLNLRWMGHPSQQSTSKGAVDVSLWWQTESRVVFAVVEEIDLEAQSVLRGCRLHS